MSENRPSSVERQVVQLWSELEQASNGDTVLQHYEKYSDGSVHRIGTPRPMVYVAGQWYLRDQVEREH